MKIINRVSFLTLQLLLFQSAVANSYEREFLPNKPTIFKNPSNKSIQSWCEMHVNAYSDNTLFIKQTQGTSEINGTTLSTGNTMTLTVSQLQSIEIFEYKKSQIEWTNLGNYIMKAVCFNS